MKPFPTPDQIRALAPIKLAVFDVDGILTEGSLSFLSDGSEIKTFNILDGLGLKMLMKSGIETAIITGRRSNQVIQRAEALGINYVQQGREDKLTALKELWQKTGYGPNNTSYMGDDLPDLSAIKETRFGITVPNGHWFVQQHADWITQRPGGQGAVREVCELILAAQNNLDEMLESFL